MAPTRPLRTALIGLSASSQVATSWAANAHLPGLLNAPGRSRFTITALLNSSVEAAQNAIKAFDLPSTTKAYGSPDDLANDPDIDLVICNTRVDKHYQTLLPSIKAGKYVFVEWPIAKPEQIEELVNATRNSGSKVAVGLQGRWAPPVSKLREILQDGKAGLGKVLSSEVRAFGGSVDREILPTRLSYFTQRDVGGNGVTIGFGHLIDSVLSVLGELDPKTVQTRFQLQRPEIRIKDAMTGEIVDKVKSDVPDLISLHGSLQSSEQVAPNASLIVFHRRGQQFPGTPALTWTINCEFGEIQLISPGGSSLQVGNAKEPITIRIHRFATDEVEDVEWAWSKEQEEVGVPARNVMTVLYAFADGKPEGDGWVSIEDAAKRARWIESLFQEWDKEKKT